ncbi:MAG: flavin reductase family protein [Candidatus Woesearchaeota archaeon]
MDFEIFNPRQTVIATCRGICEIFGKKQQKDNGLTLDWHMPVSFDPPMYAIAVGKTRFSYKLISQSKVFAVNFLSSSLKDAAIFFGRHSGQFIDKFQNTEKGEAQRIDCPILRDATAVIECEVINEIEAGDHCIFIGRILYASENVKEKRLFHTKNNKFAVL